eukprot:6175273-Pleurochrysis_carterae.AAC.1
MRAILSKLSGLNECGFLGSTSGLALSGVLGIAGLAALSTRNVLQASVKGSSLGSSVPLKMCSSTGVS